MKTIFYILFSFFLCSNSWGATELKKTVCPSGCDYTTLEACMHANEQDLTAADQYFNVEISGTWSSADTTAVTIDGYTTDATRYINIYTTGSALHNGVYTTGSYYLLQTSATDSLTISDNYVKITGLQINNTGSSKKAIVVSNGVTGARISKNIIKISATNQGINYYGAASTASYFWNNIIYGGGTYGIYLNGANHISATAYLYSNTIYGCGTGIKTDDLLSLYKNNISYNNTTDYSLCSGCTNSNSTKNLAKDTTTPEYNTYYDSKTLSFVSVTGGSENLHLASTDTDAINLGADLSADGSLSFSDDIDGVTRSDTWDIGADEYVATTNRRLMIIE